MVYSSSHAIVQKLSFIVRASDFLERIRSNLDLLTLFAAVTIYDNSSLF